MSATFTIPSRRRSAMHPLWHRVDASVAVTEIDPEFGHLQATFPASWRALARAKGTLDSIVSLGRPKIQSAAEYHARVRPLLDLLALDLQDVARSEAGGARRLARQAAAAAEAAILYAQTGTWPRTPLENPAGDDGPWLFCGPLKGWDVQESYDSLTLLVARPEPRDQVAVDAVDDRVDLVRATVAAALGGELQAGSGLPDMRAVRLILAGGVSSVGHKNFAHFFPLDAPTGIVEGKDFTVLFSNIQRLRLERCSLPLLAEVAGHPIEADLEAVLHASIAWFRCHDIGHFWRLVGEPAGPHSTAMAPFEQLTIEEALSDTLGVLCAAEVTDRRALSLAFTAEMLRYLSRNYRDYADSAAAVLELGWLERDTVLPWTEPQRWLDVAMPGLMALAPQLHGTLRTGSDDIAARLSAAVTLGSASMARWSKLFAEVPSDLDYSFG